jgi:hypothetical protein
LAWLVNRWLTDQLTNNAAMVTWPGTSEEFIFLPVGSAVLLTGTKPDAYGNHTTFTYRNNDQSVPSFNALNTSLVGQLANWFMPYGVSVGFTYGYSYGGKLMRPAQQATPHVPSYVDMTAIG